MRQLKNHEQKLLKKVEFLNVSCEESGYWLDARSYARWGDGEKGDMRAKARTQPGVISLPVR